MHGEYNPLYIPMTADKSGGDSRQIFPQLKISNQMAAHENMYLLPPEKQEWK